MTCIVFETPGLIDLRSFVLMGVSVKPNSANPIGYFGTGLKYAMSVLVRLGCKPVVWVGQDKYIFYTKSIDYRGEDKAMIWMRKERWSLTRAQNIMLPYATTYGRNWKAWQVYRELESNTRDENGRTYAVPDLAAADSMGSLDCTQIVVDLPEFVEAYDSRHEIFLTDMDPRIGTGVLEIAGGPSKHLYWRGMRVYDLSQPTLYTYNFLGFMDLTEDRTLSNEFLARIRLGQWVVKCDDEVIIEKIITAGKDTWEHGIIFDKDTAPSRAFHNVMLRHPKGMHAGAFAYYASHDERVTSYTYDLNSVHPFPWSVNGNAVHDRNGKTVFDAPYGYEGRWQVMAEALLKRLQPTPAIDYADKVPAQSEVDGQEETTQEVYTVGDVPTDKDDIPF